MCKFLNLSTKDKVDLNGANFVLRRSTLYLLMSLATGRLKAE